MDPKIQLLVTLTSVAVGAILTWFTQSLQFRRQQRLELNKTRLAKLEELYLALSQMEASVNRSGIHAHLFRGRVESTLVVEDDEKKTFGSAFQRVDMLFAMYFEVLEQEQIALTKAVKNWHNQIMDLPIAKLNALRIGDTMRVEEHEKLSDQTTAAAIQMRAEIIRVKGAVSTQGRDLFGNRRERRSAGSPKPSSST